MKSFKEGVLKKKFNSFLVGYGSTSLPLYQQPVHTPMFRWVFYFYFICG